MMKHVKRQMVSLAKKDDGAAMVEYGLLVGLIALVVAVGAGLLGTSINTMFTSISTYLDSIPIPKAPTPP